MNDKIKNIAVCVLMVLVLGALSLSCVLIPDKEWSDSERRKLAEFPEVSFESIFEGRFMSAFESYSVDNFPFRDTFRQIKALSAKYLLGKSDNNGLYSRGDYVSSVEYPMSEESIGNASNKFKELYEKYGGNGDVYISVIPDKNCFMAEESGHLSIDYKKFIDTVKEKNDFARFIDISELLELEDYYKTDTHWRQDKIVDVAELLCSEMGAEIDENFIEKTLDKTFYGVYYGQAADPFIKGEEIVYLTSDTIDSFKVTDHQNNKQTEVYDMERAYGKDPYEMFLSGPISLITIENPSADNDKELVIFRDSFASSIAPLISCAYSKVTLVDIRYINSAFVGSFVDFEKADILFLYSTLVLNNSETFK